ATINKRRNERNTMSDHAWALENIAAFVAGGLDAEEAERLEQHAATCPECAAALHQARSLDQGLDTLFAADRPGPEMEERAIHALRAESVNAALRGRFWRRVALGAAAAVVLGITGAAMSQLFAQHALQFPGVRQSQPSQDRAVYAVDDSESMGMRD